MTEATNPMVRAWLDEGNAALALIGDGSYFLPSFDFGDHDRLIVVGELIRWASLGHNGEAALAMHSAIDNLLSNSRAFDAADVLLAYAIVSKGLGTSILEPKDLRELVRQVRIRDTGTVPATMFDRIEAAFSGSASEASDGRNRNPPT